MHVLNNNIINNTRKVFLNLKCVLNVQVMLYGDPKCLPRLEELINSTKTAKQSVENEKRGLDLS